MNHRKNRRIGCEKSEAEQEMSVKNIVPLHIDEIVEEFLIRTRRLLLVGEIDEALSTYICSYLQVFSLKKQPVYLYINSPGGCLSSGYAIIDQMLSCNCPIRTIVRGQASSMGAIIAAFGQKKHRYSTPNSSMMLHSVIIQPPPSSVEKSSIMIDYIKDDFSRKIKDLAKRLKLTSKQLSDRMNDNMWMSPEQAIEIGLIDKIWTPQMEKELNKGNQK